MIILTPAAAATAARRYTNPITGNHAMATMGTFVQLLPKGFATAAYRSTDATVFVPIEGVAAHGSGTISSSNGASGTSSSSPPGIMSGT